MFEDLKDGWNGYGSPAPNDYARETAKRLLEICNRLDVKTHVAPDADGGIAIYVGELWLSCMNEPEDGHRIWASLEGRVNDGVCYCRAEDLIRES